MPGGGSVLTPSPRGERPTVTDNQQPATPITAIDRSEAHIRESQMWESFKAVKIVWWGHLEGSECVVRIMRIYPVNERAVGREGAEAKGDRLID